MKGESGMDIKAKIEEIVNKVKSDKDFGTEFRKDPVKAVEKAVGVDLPDDTINALVDGVKAKIDLDNVGGAIGGLLGKLKK